VTSGDPAGKGREDNTGIEDKAGIMDDWEVVAEDMNMAEYGKVVSSKMTSLEIRTFPSSVRHLYPLWEVE
jgi:hypothetical protein